MRPCLIAILLISLVVLSAAGCQKTNKSFDNNLSQAQARGLSLFGRKCRRCHKVDGAGGRRGSDLSKVGERRNADWLRRFLDNPQAVDPGNKMPAVFLRPDEMETLIEYLQTLKSG